MISMTTEQALAYLCSVGDRSQPRKVRAALQAIEPTCTGQLRSMWESADENLSDLEERLYEEMPTTRDEREEEQDARREAREDLASAIEELVGAFEDEEEDEPEPVTPPVTETPSGWHPLMFVEQYAREKLGAKEFRLQGRDRDALLELMALWAEFTRGEGPCPCCGRTDGQRGTAAFPADQIRYVQNRQARAEQIAKLEDDNKWLRRQLAGYGPPPERVTAGVTRRLCACGCGQPVTSGRPEAKYANGACRVRAHRAR